MIGIDVRGGAFEHDLNGCIFLVKHQTRLAAESEDGGGPREWSFEREENVGRSFLRRLEA